ncbi:MAG: transposase [Hyphomicrobiales bacterium]|nr:transposase [Hyphomicrobiales bacterium]
MKGKRDRKGEDNLLFFNAILRKLCAGVPWCNLPEAYGNWKTVSNRFYNWRNTGVWERLLDRIASEPGLEWIMIDANHIKATPCSQCQRGKQTLARTRGGLNTKLHLAVEAHGLPVRMSEKAQVAIGWH